MGLVMMVLTPRSTSAQSDVDAAIRFFSDGGAYCFRVAPEGVTLSQESEWTVMLLTSSQNKNDTFRIRSVDPGKTGLSGQRLATSGIAVTNVWRLDRSRENFFGRFAKGIEAGTLRARVVKVAPPGLAEMTPSARVEQYLKFADRGSRVSFKNIPDLTSTAFLLYDMYFPD